MRPKHVSNIKYVQHSGYFGNPIISIEFDFKIADYSQHVVFTAPSGLTENQISSQLENLVTDHYYSDFLPYNKKDIISYLREKRKTECARIMKQYAIMIESIED